MTNKDSKLKSILKAKAALEGSLRSCAICPRKCKVDRISGSRGYCRAPANPVIYSYSPHHGEEPPLSGKKGSGTIFFSHCNLKCVYCQNYTFSQMDKGETSTIEGLAKMMLQLKGAGCHNINLVSPAHFVPQIVDALELAVKEGLDIPIVYNTSGYELVETIRLLEGIVDIYLPDMRYSDNEKAKKYSDAPDYVSYNRESVIEMHRQVGGLAMDEHGIAMKGIIVRLLALPEEISGLKDSMLFIKEKLGPNTYLSIMSQYYPTYKSRDYREISRPITLDEYKNVVDAAHLLGLNNGWIQDMPEKIDEKFRGTNIKPKKL